MAGNQEGDTHNSPTRQRWTAEQRVEAGAMAAEAMGSPIFEVVHGLLQERYFIQFRGSEAKDKAKLLGLKDKIDALDDMMLLMADMVEEAQRIVTDRQAAPQRRRQEQLDTQGFGLGRDMEEMSDVG